MLYFVFILALSLTVLHNVRAICHECYPNGVTCISDKKFQFCVKGKVITTATFSCLGDNEICTNDVRVCMNKNLFYVTQACGAKYNCGKCEGKQDDGKFSCTSRTTFTMCSDGKLTQTRGSCPADHICDVGLSKELVNPCVPKSKLRKVEICDLYEAIDVPTGNNSKNIITTPQPSTTTTQDIAEKFCSKQSKDGRHPFPGDRTCRGYIYCYKKDGVMRNRVAICSEGYFFDSRTLHCRSTDNRTPICI